MDPLTWIVSLRRALTSKKLALSGAVFLLVLFILNSALERYGFQNPWSLILSTSAGLFVVFCLLVIYDKVEIRYKRKSFLPRKSDIPVELRNLKERHRALLGRFLRYHTRRMWIEAGNRSAEELASRGVLHMVDDQQKLKGYSLKEEFYIFLEDNPAFLN